jgi:Fic-DOC domain mobile mystery protein B
MNDDNAATPLTESEWASCRLSWVSSRADLNEVEQMNIASGVAWGEKTMQRRELLDDSFVRELHRRMFGNVWSWAGKYRTSERNIGISAWKIATSVRELMQDALTWIEFKTYEEDEIAVRLHHKLVFIHPFPNGNGRHSRLMADLLAIKLNRQPFSWGRSTLTDPSEMRQRYIRALQEADSGSISKLMEFARS